MVLGSPRPMGGNANDLCLILHDLDQSPLLNRGIRGKAKRKTGPFITGTGHWKPLPLGDQSKITNREVGGSGER